MNRCFDRADSPAVHDSNFENIFFLAEFQVVSDQVLHILRPELMKIQFSINGVFDGFVLHVLAGTTTFGLRLGRHRARHQRMPERDARVASIDGPTLVVFAET